MKDISYIEKTLLKEYENKITGANEAIKSLEEIKNNTEVKVEKKEAVEVAKEEAVEVKIIDKHSNIILENLNKE